MIRQVRRFEIVVPTTKLTFIDLSTSITFLRSRSHETAHTTTNAVTSATNKTKANSREPAQSRLTPAAVVSCRPARLAFNEGVSFYFEAGLGSLRSVIAD